MDGKRYRCMKRRCKEGKGNGEWGWGGSDCTSTRYGGRLHGEKEAGDPRDMPVDSRSRRSVIHTCMHGTERGGQGKGETA